MIDISLVNKLPHKAQTNINKMVAATVDTSNAREFSSTDGLLPNVVGS